jgi:Leucine-rich repeat (LRR) protein
MKASEAKKRLQTSTGGNRQLTLVKQDLSALPPLSHFPDLINVNVQENQLEDISFLSQCQSLKNVNISGMYFGLRRVHCTTDNKVTAIKHLAKSKKLLVIRASRNQIETVEGTLLAMSLCVLTSLDLSGLPELGALILDDNKLSAVPKNLPVSLNTLGKPLALFPNFYLAFFHGKYPFYACIIYFFNSLG